MPLRILLLNWRDMHHPEAGGAEKYLVTVAEGLADRGHEVIFRTAAYPGALPDEVVNGVHYIRKGGRYGIYPRALAANLVHRYAADVVVDVQNGMPYLSPLTRRRPVVNLVHHVHKEQWPVVFGPRLSRAGWWLESRLAPTVYRRSRYVAVSDSTKREPERTRGGSGPDPGDPQRDRPHPAGRHPPVGAPVPRGPRQAGAAEARRDRARDRRPPRGRDPCAHAGRRRFRVVGPEPPRHRPAGSGWRTASRSTVTSPRPRSTGSSPGPGSTSCPASRRDGGWWSSRRECTARRRWPSPRPVDPPTRSCTGAQGCSSTTGPTPSSTPSESLLSDADLRRRMSEEVVSWVAQFHWDEAVEKWERALLDAAGRQAR